MTKNATSPCCRFVTRREDLQCGNEPTIHLGIVSNKPTEILAGLAKEHWHKLWALGIALFLAIGSFVTILGSVDFGDFGIWHWVALTVLTLGVILIWVHTNRLPKARRGTIGIGIAISSENELQAKQLRSDFTKQLRERMHQLSSNEVSFIEFRSVIAELLVDSGRESAAPLMRKSRCHFLIYGQAKQRLVQGERKHILELNGVVLHAPVARETSARLSGEFREMLPSRVMFKEEGDIFAFEITAALLDAVTRYIIGIAAGLSGDFIMAERIFVDLREAIDKGTLSGVPLIEKIKSRLPERIAEALSAHMGALYHKYQMSRDKSFLVDLDAVSSRLQVLVPDDYKSHLIRAICLFVLKKDAVGARREIMRCRNAADGIWLWSKAFLEAYELKFEDALQTYRKAFAVTLTDPSVPIQCEEFITCILDDEPDKGQLYYALGLINRFSKSDPAAAKSDFERFIAWTRTSKIKYNLQVQWCLREMEKIDRERAPSQFTGDGA